MNATESPRNAPSASHPLRIAVCLQELDPLRQMLEKGFASDGTYVVQGYIASGLRARGHRLTVMAPRGFDEVEYAFDAEAPRLAIRTWSTRAWFRLASRASWRVQQWLGVPYLSFFRNLRALDAYLRILPGHDVVYERNALYSLAVARASRRLGLPYVMFFEADQLLEHDVMGKPIPGALRRRARQVLRYNLRAADCIICVSGTARTHLLRTWGAAPGKTVVCRNGVDVRRFAPNPEARTEVRRSLAIGEQPLILFVGSFFEWHDVGALLDAFARVLPRFPDARMVLAGDGRLLNAMKQRAADSGIGHAVRFTGLIPHTDVPRLLAAADLAVAPYPRMERDLWLSPLKLFEYMATGVAIVASHAGQVGEVIRHGENGLLVAPGDVPAMATAMEELIGNRELRLQLGGRAREDALREHSWERYIARLESVFDAVRQHRPLDRTEVGLAS